MPAHFEVATGRTGKTHFNLKAPNGEIVLTSQAYRSRASALRGIASVQKHSCDPENFETRVGKGGKSHFVLKAANHRVIGTSETYNSTAALKKGMRSVCQHGPKASIG